MNQLTPDQEVQTYAARFAYFVDTLNIGQEEKEVLLSLVQDMTPEEIEKTRIALEERVLQDMTIESTPEYQKAMAEQNNKTADELEALLAEIENN